MKYQYRRCGTLLTSSKLQMQLKILTFKLPWVVIIWHIAKCFSHHLQTFQLFKTYFPGKHENFNWNYINVVAYKNAKVLLQSRLKGKSMNDMHVWFNRRYYPLWHNLKTAIEKWPNVVIDIRSAIKQPLCHCAFINETWVNNVSKSFIKRCFYIELNSV